MKFAISCALGLLVFLCIPTSAQDKYVYIVKELQQAKEDGTILNTQPLQGSMTLNADGSYTLEAQSNDSGSWRLERAQGNQPARIMFDSNSGNDYFAYVQGNTILIWLMKTEQGIHLWAKADRDPSDTTQQPGVATGGAPGIVNGRFTRGVIYGGSNALAYQYQDQSTGETLGSDSIGFLFSPDGTFIMRSQSGQQVTTTAGTYLAKDGSILCSFNEGGDDIYFVIINGGGGIRWISQGQTVAEYQFMGFSN